MNVLGRDRRLLMRPAMRRFFQSVYTSLLATATGSVGTLATTSARSNGAGNDDHDRPAR